MDHIETSCTHASSRDEVKLKTNIKIDEQCDERCGVDGAEEGRRERPEQLVTTRTHQAHHVCLEEKATEEGTDPS